MPLAKLEAASREFQARDERRVDLKGLRAVIDALKEDLATYSTPSIQMGDDPEAKE